MLTVATGGRGRAILSDREQTLDLEGSWIGLALPDARGLLMSDEESPYLHHYCRFAGDYALGLARAALERFGGRGGEPGPAHYWADDRAGEFAERLHRHGRIHRRGLPDVVGPEGLEVIAVLENLAYSGAGAGAPGHHAAPQIDLRSYLFDRVAAPTDLDVIAEDLALSRSALTRRCRRETGCSVLQLHREIKIEWAKTLLSTTSISISETARRTGFADPFYFSHVFSRMTGTSPSAFRRAVAG